MQRLPLPASSQIPDGQRLVARRRRDGIAQLIARSAAGCLQVRDLGAPSDQSNALGVAGVDAPGLALIFLNAGSDYMCLVSKI